MQEELLFIIGSYIDDYCDLYRLFSTSKKTWNLRSNRKIWTYWLKLKEKRKTELYYKHQIMGSISSFPMIFCNRIHPEYGILNVCMLKENTRYVVLFVEQNFGVYFPPAVSMALFPFEFISRYLIIYTMHEVLVKYPAYFIR